VVAERGGTQLHAPKATIVVDTREQNPFSFARFRGWFDGVKHKALAVGDYSVAGLEDIVTVERKDLPDLIHSFTSERRVFVKRLRRMRDTQSLIAALVGAAVPFICSETHELGAEITASYLYQVHLYHWLETNDYGRQLADNDL
jgi:hypothetical protein